MELYELLILPLLPFLFAVPAALYAKSRGKSPLFWFIVATCCSVAVISFFLVIASHPLKLIILFVKLYVLSIPSAVYAKRTDRSPVVWFIISFFLGIISLFPPLGCLAAFLILYITAGQKRNAGNDKFRYLRVAGIITGLNLINVILLASSYYLDMGWKIQIYKIRYESFGVCIIGLIAFWLAISLLAHFASTVRGSFGKEAYIIYSAPFIMVSSLIAVRISNEFFPDIIFYFSTYFLTLNAVVYFIATTRDYAKRYAYATFGFHVTAIGAIIWLFLLMNATAMINYLV